MQIALALIALVAMLIPDLRGLPLVPGAGGLPAAGIAGSGPERGTGLVLAALGSVEEPDEDPDTDRDRPAPVTDGMARHGSRARVLSLAASPAVPRCCAHRATGPPRA
ncbi:hypothetical protein [Enterovirga aerilata]|uniref:Uncharacterized protein n=1 Tax=Enterovirga aerilata TaxID=2730920 RepID=A0A849I924_9HYPH|nr:hypothetical protein [Enterovirga sp. DB1703]NNM72785.1 hypothetical protein [Enterovirga sp. DB1703]